MQPEIMPDVDRTQKKLGSGTQKKLGIMGHCLAETSWPTDVESACILYQNDKQMQEAFQLAKNNQMTSGWTGPLKP